MRKVWLDDIFGLPRWTIFILFVSLVFFGWLYGHVTALNLTFNGVIQKVRYDGLKREPYITIKGVEYELGYSRWLNYNDTLAVGDSAVKRTGTTDFILIKKKNSTGESKTNSN
jgi:hypothetical protein